MSYVVAALVAAFLYGVGIVGEKVFIEHHGSVSEWTLVFLSTSTFAIISLLLVPFAPISFNFEPKLGLVFLATGGLYAGAMVLWFYAINREAASKVGQLASLESIVTPVFAVVFLSESPSSAAVLAIGLIVVGLLMLVFDRGVARAIVTAKVAVIPILVCLVMWATQDTLIKFALSKENFWTVFFWTRIVSFSFFVSLLSRSSVRSDVLGFFSEWKSDNTHILIGSKIATTIGLLASVFALSLGPLSVVSPVLASYPVFVFAIGFAVTRFSSTQVESDASTPHILKRGVSILLFMAGVFVLYWV